MNEHVLVIDNEQDSVDSIRDLLGEANISSRGETDPEMAVTNFQANPTDVVIIDYLLEDTTGVTGLEIVSRLREIKPFTRFVMISAWMPREDEDETATKMKVDAFIKKPFDATRLIDLVQQLLETIESKSDDWASIAEEYVAQGMVTAEEVRSVNEEFKQKIIDAFEKEDSE
jgi:DNA-binding NtrC family response regulator